MVGAMTLIEQPPTPAFTLGEHLAKVRELRGLTPADMAALLDCHVNTVRNYEAGRTPVRRPVVVMYADEDPIYLRWLMSAFDDAREDPGGEAKNRCFSSTELGIFEPAELAAAA